MRTYYFNPRDILFRHSAGLESLLAFKDDPGDDDDDEGDQDSDDSGDDSGGKTQPSTKPAGDPKPPPGSSASDAKYKALEAKLDKERKAREKLELEKKAREDEKKSELDKAKEAAELEKGKREAAERNLQAMRIENALRSSALKLGVRGDRLEGALRLIDRSAVTIDGDELDGVDEAVEKVKKEFPEFFGAKATSSPGTGGGKGGDRGGDDDGPQTDYEVGQALAKQKKETKSRI